MQLLWIPSKTFAIKFNVTLKWQKSIKISHFAITSKATLQSLLKSLSNHFWSHFKSCFAMILKVALKAQTSLYDFSTLRFDYFLGDIIQVIFVHWGPNVWSIYLIKVLKVYSEIISLYYLINRCSGNTKRGYCEAGMKNIILLKALQQWVYFELR